MNLRRILYLFLIIGFILTEVQAGEDGIAAPLYVRYVGDDRQGVLETVVVTMEKEGITVDLIGAIHIADGAYYQALEQSFTSYDALLFELVDGQNLAFEEPESTAAEEDSAGMSSKDAAHLILHDGMKKVGEFLKLEFQTGTINYRARNFVHADVSWDRFKELQEEKGESWFSLFQQMVEVELKRAGKQPEMRFGMLIAGLLGDPSALKVALARQLNDANDLEAAIGNETGSVIIGERNKRALEVLAIELGKGRRKLGIFYGAGHLADMERRMIADGWKRVRERWNTAWEIRPTIRIPTPAQK